MEERQRAIKGAPACVRLVWAYFIVMAVATGKIPRLFVCSGWEFSAFPWKDDSGCMNIDFLYFALRHLLDAIAKGPAVGAVY